MRYRFSFALFFSLGAFCASTRGDDSEAVLPKPVPATRPEVKRALEALKSREPRLPLPPPTDEERKAAGDRPLVNNGRMAAIYLPASWRSAKWGKDPAMTLDYPLTTECFWIVSRGNNCHYCLGHQEHKLASVGLSDNRIASLDSDWSVFLPREQAAFALARKLTLAPHTVTDTDVDDLRKFFTDTEIVELVFTIARFNSTNRWTDSMGIPQDRQFREVPVCFDAPTSERFREAGSLVAPAADQHRPPLESRSDVEAALSACRQRSARVALPGADEARAVLPAQWRDVPVPEWVRALSLFPETGASQIASYGAVADEGRLDKLLKAQIAWTCARQDRAWYALADAQRRLAALGQSIDEMFALDRPDETLSPAVREVLAFAAKLTSAPHSIADADIAQLRKRYSDYETAEIVYVVCSSNWFDRLTETLGLKWFD
jgi:alkylhydroperoxidase family enzyme